MKHHLLSAPSIRRLALAAAMLLAMGGFACGPTAPAQSADGQPDEEPDKPPVIEVAQPTVVPDTPAAEPQPQPSGNVVMADHAACFQQLIEAPQLSSRQQAADEALYHQGLDHERADRLDLARKTYLELVEVHKSSPFVPLAYLRFAELFAEEGRKDPAKLPIAQNFYKEVMKYMPPESQVLGYAAFRSGLVHQQLDEHAKAIDSFKRAIDYHNQFPREPCSPETADLSRNALISSYAEAGHPMRAYAFFRPLSGDTGANTSHTAFMILRLAEAYASRNKERETLGVLTDLLKRAQSPEICQQAVAISSRLRAASATAQRELQRIKQSCP